MNAFLLSDAAPLGQAVHGWRPAEPGRAARSTITRSTRRTRPTVEARSSIGAAVRRKTGRQRPPRVTAPTTCRSPFLPPARRRAAKAACALAGALARGDDVARAQTLVRRRDWPKCPPTGRSCSTACSAICVPARWRARRATSAADIGARANRRPSAACRGLGIGAAKLNVAMHLAESLRDRRTATAKPAPPSSRPLAAWRPWAAIAPRWPARCSTTGGWPATCWGNRGRPSGCFDAPWRSAVPMAGAPASRRCCSTTWPARCWSRDGRREALDIAERAAAEASRLGNDVVVVQSMLFRATRVPGARRPRPRRRAADRVRAAAEGRLPPGHVAFCGAGLRAGAARRGPRRRRGRSAADRAVATPRQHAGPGTAGPRAVAAGEPGARAGSGRRRGDRRRARFGAGTVERRSRFAVERRGSSPPHHGPRLSRRRAQRRGPCVVDAGGAPPRLLGWRGPCRHPPCPRLAGCAGVAARLG